MKGNDLTMLNSDVKPLLKLCYKFEKAATPSNSSTSSSLPHEYRALLAEFIESCNQEIASLKQRIGQL